jgi:hypothetical protein
MNVNGFNSKAAALKHLREAGHVFNGLLARPESNPKVAKNGKLGVLSAPLHLAPFDLSGFQVCPQASVGCAAACLHTAGNPAYMAGKDASRKDKTRAYFTNRDAFLAVLVFEIAALSAKAAKLGMEPAVRLNATSDLPWEVRKVTIDGQTVGIMDYFPEVQFYDYTKVTKRALAHARGQMPVNYHLTFSKTEDNMDAVRSVLSEGGNVAVVFAAKGLIKQEAAWRNLTGGFATLIDGDETDYRPADPKGGVVVALYAKGDAKSDTSGFTVR